MSSFDKECPRCQGKGLAKPAVPTAAPAIAQVAPAAAPSTPTRPAFLSMAPLRIAGLCFIGIGIIGYAYFSIVFDTSIAVPGWGRVNNIGLLQERSNGVMMSGGAFALGVILYAMDYLKPKS